MKVICEREKLLQSFQMAASVAPSRSTKTVLQNVRFEVDAERSVLSATDLEIGIRVEAPGFRVEAPGTVLLPVTRFGSILRESADEELLIESDGTKIHVAGRQSEFNLPSEDPNEFPAVRPFQEDRYHEVSARFFREVVRRTVFATDNESVRYSLGGVLLELVGDKLVAVATDGRRLAMQEGPATTVNEHTTADNTTVIPTRAMQLLEKAVADNDENIQIAIRQNDIMVKSGNATLYSRLVEGRFPKWRDVFPRREGAARIELPVGPFQAAVRQAAIVTSDEHRGIDFSFAEGKVTLRGLGAESGDARIELPIAYNEAPRSIKLDNRFVTDFLRVLDGDSTFTLEVDNAEGPAIARTDDGYGYVIMPLARD